MAANPESESEGGGASAVRRRLVFYIGGFDPRSPAYYHGLYRDQAQAQAALTGAAITVGRRRGEGPLVSRWDVRATYDGQVTDTEYRLLRWDDLVRARWKQGELALLGDIWRCAAAFTRAGVPGLAIRRGWAVFVAGVAPLVVSSLYILAVLAVVAACGLAALHLAHRPGPWRAVMPLLFALGLLTQAPALWRWLDGRLVIGWLNRCFAYMIDTARAPGEAGARCDSFARVIADTLDEAAGEGDAGEGDVDEILLVGHSQGTLHAVRTMARLLALAPGLGAGGPALSLLTLGQPFAVYTPLPDDRGFRRDLGRVAACDRLRWLDQTSPADPVSSCGVDPLNGLVVEGRLWPVRRSPRFHLLLSRRRFRQIKLKPFDFHFQYLMAGEVVGAYDYFRLTAGPDRLLSEEAG